ncbi:hypothetical protein LTR56_020024 [Elasticomyces elasticus]|nr:hypothetical protein LTR56_020024 [Elasticomyces elasticus]KAK3634159.1 hypothetical protein LTR22_019768 [Elasticomyces elasticus]KAK4911219.1 hypothetical protein LTR49_020185 [Elasticomyces elasticus]KAK5750698.1 hypothetical protein LTS12_019229 [Elasticomyces elasticus]
MHAQAILSALALAVFATAQTATTAPQYQSPTPVCPAGCTDTCSPASTLTTTRYRYTGTVTSTLNNTVTSTVTATPSCSSFSSCSSVRAPRRTTIVTTTTVLPTPSCSSISQETITMTQTASPSISISTVTSVSVSTISATPSVCPYSGPYINLFTFRSNDCSTGGVPNGLAPQFLDYKLSLGSTDRRESNCVSLTNAPVGSFSFTVDGVAAPSNCQFTFYDQDFCASEDPFAINVATRAGQCIRPLGPARSVRIYC